MIPDPSFAHLIALSQPDGLVSRLASSDHRYRVEGAAGALVAVCRERTPSAPLVELARTSFRLLADAQGIDGTVRSERTERGRWRGDRHPGDAWARSVGAFATAAGSGPDPWMREAGRVHARRGLAARSTSVRSMAIAALGAAELVAIDRHHPPARALLVDAVAAIGPRRDDPAWPWPSDRVDAMAAVVPDALLAAGAVLGRPDVVDDGLALLGWLVDRETASGHLSPTPDGGRVRSDPLAGFDQRPVDVAALAAACTRAAALTGDRRWIATLEQAWQWFAGANDLDVPLWHADAGACAGRLTGTGPSADHDAEATLALISTLQCGRLVAAALG
ncbi:glycosyltransferase [Iamia sp. SCSIO 61187]|uniref:hypothetical protein n=1 Tax=Iamia sp. SCSIO 61187 TaxID=2722752 RepID=UPI001C629A54|nr:hypothetical protein [Iamia sp. SCSIO 61187]QYG94646.1 glycosyltransferase [Iamia sp. SCSIO 61187]